LLSQITHGTNIKHRSTIHECGNLLATAVPESGRRGRVVWRHFPRSLDHFFHNFLKIVSAIGWTDEGIVAAGYVFRDTEQAAARVS